MSKFREMLHEDGDAASMCQDDTKLAECIREDKVGPTSDPKSSIGRLRFGMTITTVLLLPIVQSMDTLCMAVALPDIADHFDAFDRFSWFSNLFLISMLAFNLAFAQWLQLVPAKYVALLAISLYTIGLASSGAADHVTVMLLGRAISGLGAAGLVNSAIMIVTEVSQGGMRFALFVVNLASSFAIYS
jgi:MFS family permease